MGIVIACTSLVLIILSLVLLRGYYVHFKYPFLQSTILALLTSIPTLLIGVVNVLEFLVRFIFKITFVLGGTDEQEVGGRMVQFMKDFNSDQDQGW